MIFGYCTSTVDHHAAEGMIRDKKLKQKKTGSSEGNVFSKAQVVYPQDRPSSTCV